MSSNVRIGVVGAGPWAGMTHVPMLVRHPDVDFVGVWGRRREAAEELTAQHGGRAYDSVDQLIADCDALAFCVPPDVQVTLASQAARAGKAVLLEKPVSLDLAGGRQLADAVAEAGVVSQLFLTWRYARRTREFLEQVAAVSPIGGRGIFVNGLQQGGVFATPWRLQYGALYDLGPHVLDMLEASLGTIVDVRAQGELLTWIALTLTHESGLTSQASLSIGSPGEHDAVGIEIYAPQGRLRHDGDIWEPQTFDTIVSEFVAAVRSGTPHPLDVHHGLHLQALLVNAAEQLTR